MNALNVRTAADFRALLYTVLPIFATLLVGYGVLDNTEAALWSGLVLAVLGPVVAAIYARTLSSFRVAFYAVLGAVQALVVGYGLLTDAQVGAWLPLVNALVGAVAGGVASANTNTSPERL